MDLSRVTDRLVEMLVREEGEVLHAYQDHLGYWTIGVGRLIDSRKGGGLSTAESRFLLSNDTRRVEEHARSAYPWFRTLDDARQAVVIGMIFQMGTAGFAGFRNTISHIAAGRYAQAAVNMLESKWARQTPGRAWRMMEQMRTGEWQ